MILQRNCGQFIRSPPIVRKINRRITLVFHYSACIDNNLSQLFCTSAIENINQAIDIYEKCDLKYYLKKFPKKKIFPTKNFLPSQKIILV